LRVGLPTLRAIYDIDSAEVGAATVNQLA